MIKTKKEGFLIVVSGPTSVGKDTICNEVVKDNLDMWISISMTTRSIREHECEGINYYYVSEDEFKEKIKNDEFLEYAVVHSTDYYGTPKKQIYDKLNAGIDVILVIDIQGALKIKKVYDNALFIFILPPSIKELTKRLIARNGGETHEQIMNRFKSLYKEINYIPDYNYVIVNDDLETAVNKMKSIIVAEKCRVDRIDELVLDTKEEELHEMFMDEKKD